MVNVYYTSEFKKHAKRLAKKYVSFVADLSELQERLKENPYEGIDLGKGIRKIRMRIASKGKGKSGGARVISFIVAVSEDVEVTLLTIYDKSEQGNISDKSIKQLVAGLRD